MKTLIKAGQLSSALSFCVKVCACGPYLAILLATEHANNELVKCISAKGYSKHHFRVLISVMRQTLIYQYHAFLKFPAAYVLIHNSH